MKVREVRLPCHVAIWVLEHSTHKLHLCTDVSIVWQALADAQSNWLCEGTMAC